MNLSYIVDQEDLLNMTSHIVSNHAANNKLTVEELCDVTEKVYQTFHALSQDQRALTYKDLMNDEEDVAA